MPRFATANPSGLTFNVYNASIPINRAAALGAIGASFNAWDSVDPTQQYFTVNSTGGPARPALDGNNSVGWVNIVPKTTLTAAWVWTDATGAVTEADIYFNGFHKWGVFATCNAEGK